MLTREVPYAERAKAAVQPLEQFIQGDRLSATNREAAKEAIGMIKAGEWPTTQFTSGGPGTAGIGRSYANAKDALAEARKIISKDRVGQDQLNLGTTRSWTCSRSTIGTTSADLTISIRSASSGTVLASANVVIAATQDPA